MKAVPHSRRMTVEEAWLARLRAADGSAAPADGDAEPGLVGGRSGSGSNGAPAGADAPGQPPAAPEPAVRSEPPPVIGAAERAAPPRPAPRTGPPIVTPLPRPETRPPARPRIEPEPAILGLSRHTRSRLGARLFNLFFVFVFALILIQMIVALLTH